MIAKVAKDSSHLFEEVRYKVGDKGNKGKKKRTDKVVAAKGIGNLID